MGEDFGEEGFAVVQREVAGVVAVEMEEVEAEVGEVMPGALLEGGLQVGEAGGAVGGEDDDLAVEGDLVGREAGDLSGDGGHAVGPVEALAGEELDAVAVFASLHAVAVEFEFVQPAVVGGRGLGLLG